MWESWRTYLSFVLVGAIFVVCQALSGGVADTSQGEGLATEPGDSTYREVLRLETTGRGGMILSGDVRPSVAPPSAPAAEDKQQTD
jgi:hypothetical protein